MSSDIKKKISERIEMIPALSPVATRLVQLTSNPDYSVGEIVDIVRCDSALTARLLRIVNSPVFGLRFPIESIDRAVIYLGPKMVAGIAIGESAPKLFNTPLHGYDSEAGELWSHILFAAIAAREMANFCKQDIDPGVVFTAGILHDIGKAVISDFMQNCSKEILEEIRSGDADDFKEGEQDHVGVDHTEVGYMIAQRWKLPESLCQAILHHHNPSDAAEEFRALAYGVHVGDIMAMQWGCGTGSDTLQYRLDEGYEDYYQFTPEAQAFVMIAANEEYLKLKDAILDAGGSEDS